MTTKQLHIRLTPDEMRAMEEIARQCEVNPTVLGGFFIRAALRAARSYGKRITLPPCFEMTEIEEPNLSRLHEPSPPAAKRK